MIIEQCGIFIHKQIQRKFCKKKRKKSAVWNSSWDCTMSNTNIEIDRNSISSLESEDETLYRLATPPGQLSDHNNLISMNESESEVVANTSEHRFSVNRLNSLHTNGGIRGNESGTPRPNERLSRTQRPEKPIKIITTAEVHDVPRDDYMSRKVVKGGRLQK